MSFTAADHAYMARALQLAEQGLWTTTPNPRVGCVLVRDGEMVGEGWHAKAGEPHAEVHALRMAGERARGATAYVTLEPCAHFGRTPPCAKGLIEAGVSRVVSAMQDPNPLVAGKGLAMLAEEPGDAFLRYAIALEHKRLGDFDTAIGALEALLTDDPAHVPSYYQLALMLGELGRLPDAVRARPRCGFRGRPRFSKVIFPRRPFCRAWC